MSESQQPISRQQRRRAIMKGAQRLLKDNQALAARAAVAAVRAARKEREKLTGKPVVVQGPGKLGTSRRAFKKPHGQANWRVRTMKTEIMGIPATVEMHTTKGPRRWTLAL